MTAEETLRRAATLMRERAEAATPGPWWNESGTVHAPYPGRELGSGSACHPLNAQNQNGVDNDADGEHAASWHPDVALAVADWLERVVEHDDTPCPAADSALAVARAYLGESGS